MSVEQHVFNICILEIILSKLYYFIPFIPAFLSQVTIVNENIYIIKKHINPGRYGLVALFNNLYFYPTLDELYTY